MSVCDWCGQPLNDGSLHLTNGNGMLGGLYPSSRPLVTLDLHRECWQELSRVLSGVERLRPASSTFTVGPFTISVRQKP
jgi:hypothetical protein